MTPDYQVRLIHFPHGKIRETVTENADGTYTIFIEDSLSKSEQREVFLHALEHILHDDFHSMKNVQEIERRAHGFNTEVSKELCHA